MTVRELIQKIEAERDALKKENKNLKSTIDKLTKEKKLVENELKSLKDLLFESEQKEKELVKIQEEVKEEPSPDPKQPEKPIQYSDGAVLPIHTVTVGNGEGVEITGIKGTQEDLLKSDGEVVEETPAKTKRSRKKKVEPVKEPENA